jgi:hypothetical protein
VGDRRQEHLSGRSGSHHALAAVKDEADAGGEVLRVAERDECVVESNPSEELHLHGEHSCCCREDDSARFR